MCKELLIVNRLIVYTRSVNAFAELVVKLVVSRDVVQHVSNVFLSTTVPVCQCFKLVPTEST